MRFVVSPDEIAHLWANKAQSHAKSKGCGNFFFSGDSIWSYGHHFEVARHVKGSRGRSAVIITTRRYSCTTAKHIAMAGNASRHLTQFHAPLTSGQHVKDYIKHHTQEMGEELERAARARGKKLHHFNMARYHAEEGNRIAEFFGIRQRITLPDDMEIAITQAREAKALEDKRNAARNAKWAKEQEKIHAARMAEAIALLPDWKAGNIAHLPAIFDETYLRFIDDGQNIQTSRGAVFPADHGQRAFNILKRLYDRAESYHRNGTTIHCGHYAIDSMDTAGIRAGCHYITWPILEDFARNAGWISPKGWEEIPASEGVENVSHN